MLQGLVSRGPARGSGEPDQPLAAPLEVREEPSPPQPFGSGGQAELG